MPSVRHQPFAGHQFTQRVPDRRGSSASARAPCTGDRRSSATPAPPDVTATATRPRTKRGSTRTKMLVSAAEVMRERGAAGVTIDEVLTRSGAPRGSVYHHFPEGRNQILTEALRYAGEAITAVIDDAAQNGGMFLVRQFVDFWEELLAQSDFTAGCPVVAAAIGSGDDEPQLTSVAGSIFSHWRDALTRAFVADGFDAVRRRISGHHVHRVARRARWSCAGPPAARIRCAMSQSGRIPDQVKGIRAAADRGRCRERTGRAGKAC